MTDWKALVRARIGPLPVDPAARSGHRRRARAACRRASRRFDRFRHAGGRARWRLPWRRLTNPSGLTRAGWQWRSRALIGRVSRRRVPPARTGSIAGTISRDVSVCDSAAPPRARVRRRGHRHVRSRHRRERRDLQRRARGRPEARRRTAIPPASSRSSTADPARRARSPAARFPIIATGSGS